MLKVRRAVACDPPPAAFLTASRKQTESSVKPDHGASAIGHWNIATERNVAVQAKLGRKPWLYASFAIAVLGVLTVVPYRSASPDLLGYRTLCAQAPLSTGLLVLASFLSYRLCVRGRRGHATSSNAPSADEAL